MADLLAEIDRRKQIARFSGRATFAAKDRIKALGSARWLREAQTWEVRGFTASADQLRKLFTDIEVIETGAENAEEMLDLLNAQPEPARGSELPPGVSVSQLNASIREILYQAFPGTFFVYGTLSGVKRKNGAVFMDLCDAQQAKEYVSCVIWRDEEQLTTGLAAAGFTLEQDLQVMFEVRIDLNRRNASISLTVASIVAEYTIAKAAAQRELTNQKLKAEGIFDLNRTRKLPFLPRRLGVLTSAAGTVINDFMASLTEACFGFELFWVQVSVQGADAKRDILSGFERLRDLPELDAVLLFRGGGSAAELSVFNDYDIAKQICLFPLPVLSAIGHQQDQSSAQDVSFLACGVPKDIGRYFSELVLDLRRRYCAAAETIHRSSGVLIAQADERLGYISSFLFQSVRQLLIHKEERFQILRSFIPAATKSLIAALQQRLIDRFFPMAVLSHARLGDAERRFINEGKRLEKCLISAVERQQQALHRTGERIDASIRRVVHVANEKLKRTSPLAQQALVSVERRDAAVSAFDTLFRELSPEAQLRRGFALIKQPGAERFITSGAALESGDTVEIQFSDRTRDALIK